MPDAHWGYGFPIGGVAAFDPDAGRRRLGRRRRLRHLLRRALPAHGARARRHPRRAEARSPTCCTTASRRASAAPARSASAPRRWTPCSPAARGGRSSAAGASPRTSSASRSTDRCRTPKPGNVSPQAKKRQRDEMGTLGCGNHYLEVQEVTAVFDAAIAAAFGLAQGDIVVSIHCGSRGLGHQIGTELPEARWRSRPRATASRCPTASSPARRSTRDVGQDYLGAMRAAINCALANRQILTHLVREVFARGPAAGAAAAALRRLAQHLQGRGAPRSTAARASSTCTARARRAPSARAIRTCPSRCARPASRC